MLNQERKPYLTIEETATLLALHPETVRKHLREERLPGKKIGREWRIAREALDRYMQEERNKQDKK